MQDNMFKARIKKESDDSCTSLMENEEQRKLRARVFSLKKWIINIERHPSKTPQMMRTLAEYYAEITKIQGERFFNKTSVTNIMNSMNTRIQENGMDM